MTRRIISVLAVSSVVLLALVVYLGARPVPVYTIESVLVLPAGLQRSWRVLTDFARYPEWNPYAPRIEGSFVEGETLSFTIIDDNFSAPLDLEAVLGKIIPNERFHWVGTLLMRGIHDTKHGFHLSALDDGTTRLRHYEEFRGLLPILLPDRAERIARTEASFRRMNEALAQRLSQRPQSGATADD